MSPAARSLHVFGLYLLGAGSLLLLAPGLMLAPLGLAEPADIWGRVSGMLMAIIGLYYLVAARAELRPLMQASVWVRASVIVLLGALVAAGAAPAALLSFGVVDIAAAAWTWSALRSKGTSASLRAA